MIEATPVELGEASDHAYFATFPSVGLLCTSSEGAISLYNSIGDQLGFVVYEGDVPISALACSNNVLLFACGELLCIQYYRPDIGKFDATRSTYKLPHAASVISILDEHGFVVGTDIGECLLFMVDIASEIETLGPLPEPIVLAKMDDVVTSIQISDTTLLIVAQNGKVNIIDVRCYFGLNAKDPGTQLPAVPPSFTTRLICAESVPLGSVAEVTRFGADICGGDLLFPGHELAVRSASRPQTAIVSAAAPNGELLVNLQYVVYNDEKVPSFFSCVSLTQDGACSIHLVKATKDVREPFVVCSSQTFSSKTSVVMHSIEFCGDNTCNLIVITASIGEGRLLRRYSRFYEFTQQDLQILRDVTNSTEMVVKDIVANAISRAAEPPLKTTTKAIKVTKGAKKLRKELIKAAKPTEADTDKENTADSRSNGEDRESESDQVIAFGVGARPGGDASEEARDTPLDIVASLTNAEEYSALLTQFVDHVLQQVTVQAGASRSTSPALLVNFFIKLGNTTLRSWDFMSLPARLEALTRSSRTLLCFTSKGSVEMSIADGGTSFQIYCKSHVSASREQTYTFPNIAIHASISDSGIALLRESSLVVYPHQDASLPSEFKREWKVVLPPSLTPIACAIGDARFAAVSFTNRAIIAYCGGLVCYTNVYPYPVTLLLMEGSILFVLAESTFSFIDIEARKTILTGHSPIPPTHLIWGSIDEHCVFLYSKTGVLFALNIHSIFSSSTYTWVPVLSIADQERKRITAIHNKIAQFCASSSSGTSITVADISALRPLFYFPVDVSLSDLTMYGISTHVLSAKANTEKIATVKHISALLRRDTSVKTKSSVFMEELRRAFKYDLKKLDAYPLQAKVNLPSVGDLDITSCPLAPIINADEDEIDRIERTLILKEIALNALLACSTDEEAILQAEKEYNKDILKYISLCLHSNLLPRACAALQLLRNRGAIELGLQLFSIVDEVAFVDAVAKQLDDVFGQIQEDGSTQLVRDAEVLPSGVGPFATSSLWAIKGDSLNMGMSSAQAQKNELEKQYKLMIAELSKHLAVIKAREREMDSSRQTGTAIKVIDEPRSVSVPELSTNRDSAKPVQSQKDYAPRAPKARSYVPAAATSATILGKNFGSMTPKK